MLFETMTQSNPTPAFTGPSLLIDPVVTPSGHTRLDESALVEYNAGSNTKINIMADTLAKKENQRPPGNYQ